MLVLLLVLLLLLLLLLPPLLLLLAQRAKSTCRPPRTNNNVPRGHGQTGDCTTGRVERTERARQFHMLARKAQGDEEGDVGLNLEGRSEHACAMQMPEVTVQSNKTKIPASPSSFNPS